MSGYEIIITGDVNETTEAAEDTTAEFDAVVLAARTLVASLPEVHAAEISTDGGTPVSLLPEPSISDKLRSTLTDLDDAKAAFDADKSDANGQALDDAVSAVDAAGQAALDELRTLTTTAPPSPVPAPVDGTPAAPAAPAVDANGAPVDPTAEAAAHAATTVAL
jgi:hypothetical protein